MIAAAILHQAPRAPREVRGDLPSRLEEVIVRTLEKDRDVRYQTAADLRADLKRLKREVDSHPLHRVSSSVAIAPGGSTSPSVTPTASSDSQVVIALVKRHRLSLLTLATVVVIALGGGLYLLSRRQPPALVSLDNVQITQLTTSGSAEQPAISPDGKFVAYVERQGNVYSLWIRQIANPSHVPIIKPEPGTYLDGPTVTPDGGFVDVVRSHQADPLHTALLRVPFLGGTPKKLIDNVWSPIGWSPDGQHMAFVRASQDLKSFALMVADEDGSHENRVAVRQAPSAFFTLMHAGTPRIRPAWSPDGQVIALLGVDQPGGVPVSQLVIVERHDGLGADPANSVCRRFRAGTGLARPRIPRRQPGPRGGRAHPVVADIVPRWTVVPVDERLERLRGCEPDGRSRQPRNGAVRRTSGDLGRRRIGTR